jgi:hypothetical protein
MMNGRRSSTTRRLTPFAMTRAAGGVAGVVLVVLMTGGSALAAEAVSNPQAGSKSEATCTDSWVGKGSSTSWTVAKNWSTGKVPGAASNVCIAADGVDVITDVSIRINSLLLGEEEGIALEGTSANPVTATVATDVDLTPGVISRIDMTDATIDAAEIDDQGGTIYTDGTDELASPDVVFGDGGVLQADGGTVSITGLPQLSDGTLTGGTFNASGAVVVLPGDVSSLVGSKVSVYENSAIENPSGANALVDLSSIDAQSSFVDDNELALTGSLVADGDVLLGGPAVSLAGTFTQAEGTLNVGTNLSASEVLIDQGATMSLSGTIAGNLVDQGTLETAGPGPATVTGNYTQSPGAELDVNFGEPLVVDEVATLAGSVNSGEAIPETGDRTQLITFESLNGAFSSHNPGFLVVPMSQEIDAVILPQIDISPHRVSPTTLVTVNGGSFPLSEVNLYLNSAKGKLLASTEAGYFGRFSVSFTLPTGVPRGMHLIIASGSDGSRAEGTITVT